MAKTLFLHEKILLWMMVVFLAFPPNLWTASVQDRMGDTEAAAEDDWSDEENTEAPPPAIADEDPDDVPQGRETL